MRDDAANLDAETSQDLGERRRFVVCGDDSLAYRLTDELVNRYGGEVSVILRDRREGHGPDIARLPWVDVVEAARPDADAFAAANLESADALALVAQDDVGNVDAALVAREMVPDVRVVLRTFNTRLADAVREILPDCATLSSATLAAPAFVAGALGDAVPTYVRLADRTLFVTRRDAVAAEDVLCGLSRPAARGEPIPLPEDQDLADVVLSTRAPIGSAPVPRRHRRHPLRAMSLLLSRRLGLVAAALLGLLIIGTAGLAATRDGGWWQAAYLTILTTFGGAEPDLGASGAEQGIQTALTVLSIALIPVLTAAVVDAAVNARLKRAAGGLQEPIENHVVVAGLGDVGARVVRALDDFGVPVVAIDPSPHARGVQVARELDIPVIAGDAAREEALRGASVQTARSLIVLSTDDVTNLETALFARDLQPNLRVVLRLFDGDFADRVQRTFGITRSLSVSYLAAPAFAAAMLGRQVITTIPVGRRVLVLAELPLSEGCALEDRPVSAVRRPGDAWVIAVRTGRGAQTLWGPPAGRRLTRTDRLLVVATRRGLSRLLTEIAPPAVPVHDAL